MAVNIFALYGREGMSEYTRRVKQLGRFLVALTSPGDQYNEELRIIREDYPGWVYDDFRGLIKELESMEASQNI